MPPLLAVVIFHVGNIPREGENAPDILVDVRFEEIDTGFHIAAIVLGHKKPARFGKGIRISKDAKELDYKDIFINLDYKSENDEQTVVTEKVDGKRYASVHDVLTKPLGTFYKTLSHQLADQVKTYNTRASSSITPFPRSPLRTTQSTWGARCSLASTPAARY
jgi:hypothetical protein